MVAGFSSKLNARQDIETDSLGNYSCDMVQLLKVNVGQ
jgi:hypothetical protein